MTDTDKRKRILRPLAAAFCHASAWAAGQTFTMSVSPAFLNGEFVWTNSCCPVVGSGLTFSYACDGYCRCTGCAATGYYAYEGYRLPATGGACGCGTGETVAFRNTYRAVRPSGSEDDIVVTATFEENVTGWTWTSESKATAVKVTISPQLDAPENESRQRHRFGIGEVVDCDSQPEMSSVTWTSVGKGAFILKDGSFEYKCPVRAEANGFYISGEDCRYVPLTSVVEPLSVLARDAGCKIVPGISPGQAGGILLTQRLYVLPLDVSFSGVRIEEVPNVGGSHSGYFADTFFLSEWLHGKAQRAGNWLTVFGDNRFLNDEAGFLRALPQLDERGFVSTSGTNGWTNGNLTWEVPCGWADSNVEEDDDPIGTFAHDARQIMTIDAQGNVGIQKYGNTVQRELGGGIILNGVRVE